VQDLRVGEHVFDIQFWREGEETNFEVLKGDANAVIRRSMVAAASE
jgi:hypothetical protein